MRFDSIPGDSIPGDSIPGDSIPGRGWWMYVLGAAAVVAVILSWMVPEPQQTLEPKRRVEPITYTACAEQGPPSYGTRSLSSTLEGGCTR